MLCKQRLYKRMFSLVFITGFIYLLLSLFGSAKIYAYTDTAIDNVAPTPSSGTTAGGADFDPVTGVGKGAFNGPNMYYKIYLKSGDSTTINVNQICPKVPGSPNVEYFVQSLTDLETDYSGHDAKGKKYYPRSPINSSDCHDTNKKIHFDIDTNQGIFSVLRGHTNYRVFIFSAKILPGSPSSSERYFSVKSTNNNSFVGLARADWNVAKLYSFSTIYRTSGTWSASVMFASRCGENTNKEDILIKDPDNGVYQGQPNGPKGSKYMTASIDRSAGYPANWPTTPMNWQKNWQTYNGQQVEGAALPPGGTGTIGTLKFNADDAWIYRLNINDSISPNTIQIQLPFDQFDASPIEQRSCTQFSCTVTPNYLGDPNTVQVVVTNMAPYKWGRGYQVRERSLPLLNAVNDPAGYNQAWPSPPPPGAPPGTPGSPGFSTDIPAGGTRDSTQSHPYLDNQVYFYKPVSKSVEFVLYNDTGSYADVVPWDDGLPCTASSGGISISCGAGTTPATIPGGTVTSNYTYTVKNTTATAYPAGAGYHAVATPTPGLANPPGPNPNDIPIAIPTGTNNSSPPLTKLNFKFVASYKGSYSVRFFDPSGNPIGSPDPCPGITIAPQVSPYFQVWQNDAAAGGGFNNVDSCTTAYPGYISPTTTANNYRGGIITNSSNHQSKSDFGAVALGLIPFASGEGFYSPNNTYFANNLTGIYAPPNYQGYLNSNSSYHCATDYYTKTKTSLSPKPESSLAQAISDCTPDPTTGIASCQYTWTGVGNLNLAVPFPKHHQITIYVPVGNDITIDSDIVYEEPFDPNDPTDIPYFALITQGGDINLTNNVTQLDGLYVAQPTISGATVNGGNFATCDPSSQCNSQLVVNGSVIAQHVELLRAHGASEAGVPGSIGNAPAEIFNFVPSMVLGAPAFAPICQPGACTQGTYSIAPVF